MYCLFCSSFFRAEPIGKGSRICGKALIHNRPRIIEPTTKTCDEFVVDKMFMCPGFECFIALGTCLKNRRLGECPCCEIGKQAVLLYRQTKSAVECKEKDKSEGDGV